MDSLYIPPPVDLAKRRRGSSSTAETNSMDSEPCEKMDTTITSLRSLTTALRDVASSSSSAPAHERSRSLNNSPTSHGPSHSHQPSQSQQAVRGPPTPSMTTPTVDFDQAAAARQPPPTPAPSPGPLRRRGAKCLGGDEDDDEEETDEEHDANDEEDDGLMGADLSTIGSSTRPTTSSVKLVDDFFDFDTFMFKSASRFGAATAAQKKEFLASLLGQCTAQELSFVYQFVHPLLKKDPFAYLPDEICLRILSFIDDPISLARASQVSHRWRLLVSDDMNWKNLCIKHNFDQVFLSSLSNPTSPTASPELSSTASAGLSRNSASTLRASCSREDEKERSPISRLLAIHGDMTKEFPLAIRGKLPNLALTPQPELSEVEGGKPLLRSYQSRFKERFLIESAWRSGGTCTTQNITQQGGVVTNLQITSKYIIMALDNAKIHVFDADGQNQRILQGHVMGVWAMVPWDDTLVSGGCDRDVRVWDMKTGHCLHTFQGHTSTVRCLKMADAKTAISGSRDTNIRVWDLEQGKCKMVLSGHQMSVRCIQVKGDVIVSGSYDTTVKVWSLSKGQCMQTLRGHYSQIYALAYDGVHVATGSLDTNVRVWSIATGECLAVLQGHTSLVGQLQIRGDTLVSGGSDGSVRVWSLKTLAPIHRLAAHDNSVTSLQFDDRRIVSGGSDGRVKVWDVETGVLVRDLVPPSEAVWRVAFRDDKCIVVAMRNQKTVMEVWSFAPNPRLLEDPRLSLSLAHSRLGPLPAAPASAPPQRTSF